MINLHPDHKFIIHNNPYLQLYVMGSEAFIKCYIAIKAVVSVNNEHVIYSHSIFVVISFHRRDELTWWYARERDYHCHRFGYFPTKHFMDIFMTEFDLTEWLYKLLHEQLL